MATRQDIEWDFKTIKKPGIYSQVPLELYHSPKICDALSVSSGGLRKIFNQSPAHFFATWAGNPKRIEEKESRSLIMGRALHHLFLGEPYFAKLYIVQPNEVPDNHGILHKWHASSKVTKQWIKTQHDKGLTILKPDEVGRLRGMAESLGMNWMIRHGALNGKIERSLFVKDKATGIWLKSRPDAIPTDSGDYVDMKITRSVQWNDLQRSIAEFGYHQQLALIRRCATELGMPFTSATLVFVEHDQPHCVRVVTIKDNELDRGERQNQVALDAFTRCLETGRWPGPGGDRDDAVHIELPEWAQKQIDSKLQFFNVE